VADAVQKQKRRIYVPLDSGSAPHLKAVLKTLIQKATAITAEEDEDDELALTSRKGPRLLNYDLQILYEHVRDRKIEQVVVSFPDTEALSSSLLSELIELMSSWLDRIPFVCLFNVATSVEFLQQRLSRSAVRCLDGRLFDAAPSSAETQLVFSAITHPDARLWLGPTLLASALERQSDYIQSVDELVDVVEYAYMSSYYANALSIFLEPTIKLKSIPDDHFEALRNLPSFHTWIQVILEKENTERVRKLLESNEELLSETKQQIQKGKESLCKLATALDVIRAIQECLPNTPTSPKSTLFIQAMSCKLRGSAMIRTLLLSVRKAQSDMATVIMDAVSQVQDVSPIFSSDVTMMRGKLDAILVDSTGKVQHLRSEDDIGSSTVRTTVVAQKVHLSKQKSQLSVEDAMYGNPPAVQQLPGNFPQRHPDRPAGLAFPRDLHLRPQVSSQGSLHASTAPRDRTGAGLAARLPGLRLLRPGEWRGWRRGYAVVYAASSSYAVPALLGVRVTHQHQRSVASFPGGDGW
jgi:origin recognition complex subunit 3